MQEKKKIRIDRLIKLAAIILFFGMMALRVISRMFWHNVWFDFELPWWMFLF